MPRLRLALSLAVLLTVGACDAALVEVEEEPAGFARPLTVEVAGPTAAFLSWLPADSSATPQVLIGPDPSALAPAADVALQDSVGMAIVGGLAPGQTYHVALTIRDSTGRSGASDTLSFSTRAAGPPAPEGLEPYLRDVVAPLAGARPIRPGVTLATRSDSLSRLEAAGFIAERFDALGLTGKPLPYHHVRFHRITGERYDFWGQNVYAVLPATVPSDEWVLIGGHYDSEPGSPGAVDNATGTAGVLAAARELVRWPDRSMNVMFVLFDQEEWGLVGSEEFSTWFAEGGYDLHSMHNLDMIGWDSDGDRAIQLDIRSLTEARDPAFRDATLGLGPTPRDVLAAYRLAGHVASPRAEVQVYWGVGTSDHWWFSNSVLVIEERVRVDGVRDSTPYYHGPGDTYETVHFDYTAATTRLFLDVLWLLLTD